MHEKAMWNCKINSYSSTRQATSEIIIKWNLNLKERCKFQKWRMAEIEAMKAEDVPLFYAAQDELIQ